MANEVRLIDANGRYTLHASDNTDYSLLFRNGIICIENELGHCVCEFFAEDAPTVDAEPVVHGHWVKYIFLGHDQFACSECQTLGSPQWKRCPVCEAKMDGGDEDG